MGLGDNIIAAALQQSYEKQLNGKSLVFGQGPIYKIENSYIELAKKCQLTKAITPNSKEAFVIFKRWGTQWFFVKKASHNLIKIPHEVGKRIYQLDKYETDSSRLSFKRDVKLPNLKLPSEIIKKEIINKNKKPRILIEPSIKATVSSTNKQWPIKYFTKLIKLLNTKFEVDIPIWAKNLIPNNIIKSYFSSLDLLSSFQKINDYDLVITPEGGLHHIVSATKTPAIVIFGGFIAPDITGYVNHVNIGFKSNFSKDRMHLDACGSLNECEHCKMIMEKIKPNLLFQLAYDIINEKKIRINEIKTNKGLIVISEFQKRKFNMY